MYQPVQIEITTVLQVWAIATEAQRRTPTWFANAVAWALRRSGAGDWCVNLKRGGPEDSEDAISIRHGDGAGGWAIIDIIAGFGGPSSAPAWIDVTQATIDAGSVGGGRAPTDPMLEEPTPSPIPPPPPACPLPPPQPAYPGDQVGETISVILEADYLEAGRPGLDGGCGVWVWRVAWDVALGLPLLAAVVKHRHEWRAVLGLPPLQEHEPA